MLGDIGDYLGATLGEVGHHPWQAAGALFGVPGWDPAIGGLFNNRPGGALLSPTGNFTSSAWNDMYKDNPNNTAGLDAFHRVNSVADIVAPMMAGGYAMGGGLGGQLSGLLGSSSPAGATWGGASASPVTGSGIAGLFSPGAGAGGLTGMFSGPAALGDSGLTGMVSASGPGSAGMMGGADMGSALGDAPTGLFSGLLPGGGMSGTTSGALGGGFSGMAAGAQGIGGTPAYSGLTGLGASNTIDPQMLQMASGMMQQGQQHQQPQGMSSSPMLSIGNPSMRGSAPLGPSMPYAAFGNSGAGAPWGGNPMGMEMQMLASRGLLNG